MRQVIDMFNIIVRVIIIYLIVIALMRLMGKRQLGEMEPFELVITLIIADLATIPMAEQTIPIWYGVVPLLVIAVIHFTFSFVTQKSTFMRDILSGKPVIVIDEGKLDIKELKSLNMSVEEFMEQLRNMDYFDIGDINFAIMERNGKISVIPKSAAIPTPREDMKIKVAETDVFYTIVENGKIIKRNFKELEIHHKIECIMRDILHNMLCSQKELAFVNLSSSGDVYAQTIKGEIENFKIKMPQEPEPSENELSPLQEKKTGKTKHSVNVKLGGANG